MSNNFPLSGSGTLSRKSGISALQGPGGNQTFNLFGGDEQPAPSQKPSITVTPSASNLSLYSPFSKDPNAAAPPPPKSSIAVNPNSNTFKPDANSPFSKEPAPRTGRQNSLVNVYSADSPFNPSPPPAPTQSGFVPKANIPDKNSPFSTTEFQPPAVPNYTPQANLLSTNNPFGPENGAQSPSKPAYTPKANIQSDNSPFQTQVEPQPGALERRPSLSNMQSPGGKQSFNLFGPPPETVPSTNITPTYGYAENSPFNKNALPVTPDHHRRPSKANIPSEQNPFNPVAGALPVPAAPASFVPKANIPAAESPFSQASSPPTRSDRDAANRQSTESPFVANSSPPQQPTLSFRVQQSPGGNQSFSLFGPNGYGN